MVCGVVLVVVGVSQGKALRLVHKLMEGQGMARQGEKAAVVKRYAELLSQAAAELVEREFGPEGLPRGVKFSELEQLSVELGDGLARRIMQQAVTAQAQADGMAAEICPQCGRELQQHSPDPRILLTRVGEVEWSEPECYCRSCRRAFFPSEP